MRVLPFLALCLASCTASRFYDYRFDPAPQESQVSADTIAGAQARALVTVLGIERGRDGAPDRALVRVRIENIGSTPARLVPESLSLLTADLRPFGPASVEPAAPRELAQGESENVDCGFPLPEGRKPDELDLKGLNVRFDVAFGTSRVPIGMTFQRVEWGYYDDEPRVHVGFGVGVYHHN